MKNVLAPRRVGSSLLIASAAAMAFSACSRAETRTFELRTSGMSTAPDVTISVEVPGNFKVDDEGLGVSFLPRGAGEFDFGHLAIVASTCHPPEGEEKGCDVDRLLENMRFGDRFEGASRDQIAGGREWVISEGKHEDGRKTILAELLIPAGEGLIVVCTTTLNEHEDGSDLDRLELYRAVCETVAVQDTPAEG
jgi:hypothetical protein